MDKADGDKAVGFEVRASGVMGSVSVAYTRAPLFAAASAKMPEPQPTSTTIEPRRTYGSSKLTATCVEAC